MTDIPIIVAFIAGLVSFLSPCVLPLIPGFLSYLAGSTKDSSAPRRAIMLASLFFVLGFSFVFSLLGILLNTVLSSVAYEAQAWLSRIGGIIIITFGLYLAGLLKIPFLEKEYRLQVKWKFNSRLLTAFVFGAAFAAGWTPCVGAVLGSILALAATAPGSAFYLLFSYTLGLGIPFLIVGAFAGAAGAWIARSGNILRYVNIIFGIILVLLGILIFTENLPKIANFDFINALIQR